MNKIIERETITVDDRLSKYLTGSYRLDEDEEDDCSEETDFDIIRNQYTVIDDDNVTYFDLEKSYEEREIVFQRLSDKKFFLFKFHYSPYVGVEWHSNIATEVFPTQITITKYE